MSLIINVSLNHEESLVVEFIEMKMNVRSVIISNMLEEMNVWLWWKRRLLIIVCFTNRVVDYSKLCVRIVLKDTYWWLMNVRRYKYPIV